MTQPFGLDALRGCVALLIAISWTSAVWANGHMFFRPAGKNAAVDLVYFGTIRDRTTGRPLDFVDVTIFASSLGMTFPFSNDRPGHYRSPDIGLAIKDVGEKVDPKQIEIVVYIEGYKEARRSVPRKTQGIIEVDFLMDKAGSVLSDHVSEERLSAARSWRIPALGLLVLLFSGVGARTLVRLRSTID